MFLTALEFITSDTVVITDTSSFTAKQFELFFKESNYTLILLDNDIFFTLDKEKYKKIYYIGKKALEKYNKPQLFKKTEDEVCLPYFPLDFKYLTNLLSNDNIISETIIYENFNNFIIQQVAGEICFFLKEQENKILFDLYVLTTKQSIHGYIDLNKLQQLIESVKNNTLIVFSANALRRYLLHKGIVLKSKTHDIKIMHYILHNDVLLFNITGDYANTLYMMYTSYLSVIQERNQVNFMKYLFTLKDVFGFLETRGVPVDTTKEFSFLSNNQKFLRGNKFHPIFNNLTFSGRVYTQEPSITNLPKKEKNLLVPHNSNNILYSIDFNQLELRVLYSLLNNLDFIESCNKGIDFHIKTASILFNKKINDVTEAERQDGKKYNFLILYGDYEKNNKMSLYFTSLLDERRNFINKARVEGYVRTPFGRVLSQISLIDDKQLFNFYIQSTASDLVFNFMLSILKQVTIDKKDILLYNIVHDELVFEMNTNNISYFNEVLDNQLIDTKNSNDWLKTKLILTRKEL